MVLKRVESGRGSGCEGMLCDLIIAAHVPAAQRHGCLSDEKKRTKGRRQWEHGDSGLSEAGPTQPPPLPLAPAVDKIPPEACVGVA